MKSISKALSLGLLFLFASSSDVNAGPFVGAFGAGVFLGAAAIWGCLKGPVSPIPSIPLDGVNTDSMPEELKKVVNARRVPDYVTKVASWTFAIGSIGTMLPTP